MLGFRHMPIGSVIGTGKCIFRHYGEEQPTYPDYLCFTAEEAGSTVRMAKGGMYGQPPYVSLEYSTDRENWSEFVVGNTNYTVITLTNIGDKVYLRGNNTQFGGDSYGGYNFFMMTGKIAASGNLMSIFDKTCESVSFSETSACALMFKECTSLVTAPDLPATNLASYCYNGMFSGCTALTAAPDLPATNLASYCYNDMFSGCTALTAAPDLPATTLKDYCYSNMFGGCTSLVTAPDLPATTLEYYCYSNMFKNCESLQYIKVGFTEWGYTTVSWVNGVSSSGTFVCSWELPNIGGVNNIPEGWTLERF